MANRISGRSYQLKRVLLSLIICGASTCFASAPAPQMSSSAPEQPVEDQSATDSANTAITAAVADGVTTSVALSAGAIETNPLVNTSPIGLVALTGMKIGLVKYADTLPQDEKRAVMKTSSALWGGAAANNLLVLMAAPSPVAIFAGLGAGLLIWGNMEDRYLEEDRIIAARRQKDAAPPVSMEAAVADATQTSGN
jgi:hypothetical protein